MVDSELDVETDGGRPVASKWVLAPGRTTGVENEL